MLFYKLTKEQKQILLLSSMGGLLEFYDFTIYGIFAVYFSNQFFPSQNQLLSIIAGYSVFLVGYVARPLGGILFSHIGDEIGRKTVLIITMVLMGIASLGLDLSPTYAQIGVLAPALILLFRIIQGLAIGGELPSTIVYVTESMPEARGLAMGCVFAITVGGLIPGMLINLAITHLFTAEQISSFGWRIPFIVGGFLCFIAYQVRRKLHETNAFQRLMIKDKIPFFDLLQNHLKEVILGAILVSIMATPIILAIIFMPTYLIKIVKLPVTEVSNALLIGTLVCISFTYITGILADKVSLVKLIISCAVLLPIAASLCYMGIANGYNIALSISLFTLMQGALVGLPPVFLSYLFPVQVRLSGVALSYNIAFVLFGGLTPIIVTTMIEKTHWLYLSPIIWVACISIITIIAALKARKYISNRPRNGIRLRTN